MFRTEISINPSPFRIDHRSKFFTIGSCFSDVMGEKLLENKFRTLVNPFGTVFNPHSIFSLLNASLGKDNPFEDDSVESNGIWYNYHFHSEVSALSRKELNDTIHKKLTFASDFLKQTKVLTITFGTAFVYKLQSNQHLVCNCHKQPSALFSRELLSAEQISNAFHAFYEKLIRFNPDLKIILTVSPVRHIKDTIPLNSLSKSILRLACHEISDKHEDISYFPAYEIMMDDLRDYRFYKKDMIHPSEVAEEYIWDKFCDTYIEPSSLDFMKEWAGIRKALDHKAFHPESASHQAFIRETIRKIKSLSSQADLSAELSQLENQLK
ncbi:MAG: GSCFA domain-containing protein [Cytophagaceae bacterium]